MMRKIAMWCAVLLTTVASVFAGMGSAQAASGFYISNGRLLDANGNDFIMRGINHPYIWFQNQNSSFGNIKRAGANTVRVVLDNTANTATVRTAVNECESNKLVCVLEIHNTTGWAQGNGAMTLSQAADWWLSVKGAFVGQERYVIVNLGNEPYNSSTDYGWVTQTETAISKLRNGGVSNTLMADGPGYGQDPSYLMADNAANIENSDSHHNTIFSVHMYSVYGSSSTVQSYLNYYSDRKLPLVVGEFGHHLGSSPVAWQTVMSYAQQKSLGWMAWSWSGNGGTDAQLDMTYNFNPNSLSSWGNSVINDSDGLKATAREASVYGSGGSTGGGGGSTGGTGGKQLKGQQSGKCLDVTGQATAAGSPLETWDCNGQTNQKWTIGSDGSIQGTQSGKCLDVYNQNTTSGTAVALWDCNGQPNQKWYWSGSTLRSQQSGKCLDVSGQNTADGAAIDIWDCNGQGNQNWAYS